MQVSRLGNPLFNEVIVPMAQEGPLEPRRRRDRDSAVRASTSPQPELAKLLPVLYPGRVPEPGRAERRTAPTSLAILLTGIPAGIIPGFQNFTGTTQADMLRLNVAIPPAAQPEHVRHPRRRPGRLPERPAARPTTSSPSSCGPSPARRIPLVDPTFTPDAAAGAVTDGTHLPATSATSSSFPYLDHPVSGYEVQPLSA